MHIRKLLTSTGLSLALALSGALFHTTTQAQSWNQLGQDIDGEAAGDKSGWSVALSADGNRMAIAARFNSGNGSDAGHVRLYDWSGSSWVQVGADIDGEAAGDYSGCSVALSADGSRVAIGAIENDGNGSNSGHVRLYDWSGSSWAQVGADIDGEAAGDKSGWSVALSADGSRVAIGAPDNAGNGTDSGHVRLYDWSGGSWVQVGADIDGEAAGDRSGYWVALSADGSRVAVGATTNDGNGDASGHVRLYDWSGTSWAQVGADINGEAANDWSGFSVALSVDGSRVAIGAIFNSGNGSEAGHVRLYDWTGNSWVQVGADIDGEAAGDWSGYSVALSADGSRVAIGAVKNTDVGHVRLYDWTGSSWAQVGANIDGEAVNDWSGYSVALSADGSRVAIGATSNDGNGSNSGHVRVYAYEAPACTTIEFAFAYPITLVDFAGILQESCPSTDCDGDLVDYTGGTHGAVVAGQSYPIRVKGSTGTYSTAFFTAFFDWDQDGVFEDSQDIGAIYSSTGTDALETSYNMLVPVGALPGAARMRVIANHEGYPLDPCGSYSFGQAEDYLIDVTPAPTCTGIPAPGATTGASSFCAGDEIVLGLSNAITESGFSFQWYVSTTSATGPWNAFGTDDAVQTATPSAQTWYYCEVTCTNGSSTSASDVLEVNAADPYLCTICVPPSEGGAFPICSVSFGSMSNSSCSSPGCDGSYVSYLTTVPAPAVLRGETYTLSVAGNNSADSREFGVRVFFDWDGDGTFGYTEEVGFLHHSDCEEVSIPVTIPDFANGNVVMRILFDESGKGGNYWSEEACDGVVEGQVEDYLIYVMPPPPCAGTPDPGATTGPLGACLGTEIVLGLSNPVFESGLSYQWYASTTSSTGPWTAVGSDQSTYSTLQTVDTWYYCEVTCDAGPSTAASDVLAVAMFSASLCHCTTVEFVEAVEPITLVDFAGILNESCPQVDCDGQLVDYTGVTPGAVIAGQSYPIRVQGNTAGDYITYVTAFFDWDQNGEFETAVQIGEIFNSTGTDAIEATNTIAVPAGALPGLTRMRVVKNFDEAAEDPCGTYGYGQAEDYLINVGGPSCPGDQLIVAIQTDDAPEEITWELLDDQQNIVATGGPSAGQNSMLVTETLCLNNAPVSMCYGFRLMDSFGDGISGGHWQVRLPGGKILMEDDFGSGPSSPSDSPAYSNYGSHHKFCLPPGAANIAPTECGIFNNQLGNKVYSTKVIGATKYQFEFSDPDAGFIRRIARPYNYVHFGDMVTIPLLPGVKYFARVRTDLGGLLISQARFGGGCEMGLSHPLVVHCTQLISAPAYGHSCDETRSFNTNNSFIYAKPVQGATEYQFRIINAQEGYDVTFTRSTYILQLKWNSSVAPPLTNGYTYAVEMNVKVNSLYSGFCASTCNITIENPGNRVEATRVQTMGTASMWPNPVRDGQVNLNIDGLVDAEQYITVDIQDIYGKQVFAQEFGNSGERFNTILNLSSDIASGVYMVNITVNGERTVQRLSIMR